jgi:hypothetical protein
LFKHRNDQEKGYCDNFGYKESSLKYRVLFSLRRGIKHSVGHQFYGIEYEERLLYSMAANSELFGTGLTRYNENQLCKKFLKVIEVTPLARLDVSLMEDFRFYARFLAIFASTMKKDWVKKDQGYFRGSLKARKEKQKNKQLEIDQAHYAKIMKDRKEFPEIACPGPEKAYYEREEKREKSRR